MHTLLLVLALGGGTLAHAQHSPYAGQQARDIKALSAQQQADLLAGEGLGYAKAAELNGYPGPAHVIELAGQLQLSPAQLASARELMTGHKAAARRLGAALVEAERALDQAFASGRADAQEVRQATARIGALEAQLRFEHLKTHLAQAALLAPEQVRRYIALRGYGTAASEGAGHGHRDGHGHGHGRR